MRGSKFIVVANRLPISVTKKGRKLTFGPSDGGLASAMSSMVGQENSWIGWPGISADKLTAADKKVIAKELAKSGYYPVHLTEEQVTNFYLGYSNATIWPLFHYFPQYVEHEARYWDEYTKVNLLFREEVLKHAAPDATIWIHDYHLMLLPQLLRQKMPDSSIGFFLHTPFPSFEVFRLLPQSDELTRGLLGADLIGFHTYDYTRHFLSSALRILGHENVLGTIALQDRIVHTDAFPIGIDYKRFAHAINEKAVKHEINNLRNHFHGQSIILSLDRVDYSKGILKRLEAFDLFLEQNPAYRHKITMVMIGIPSRGEVDVYQSLRKEIEQTVSRINGKYATVEWSPISYQYHSIPFAQLIALYYEADIALVTPLRDGMNLVAKEYVAVKQRRKGVLILSEMAGAASELPEALLVNPNNTESVVRAIKHALKMSTAEQKRRLHAMQSRLSKYTIQRWMDDFVDQLAMVKKRQSERTHRILKPSEKAEILQAYKKAKKKLFLLDYDGTLANFEAQPNSPKLWPSKQLLGILKKLAAQPKSIVTIVSGRPKQVLDDWFNTVPVSLVAEHGAWVKEDGSWTHTKALQPAWKDAIRPILNAYEERTPGAIVEEKDFSLVWHFRNVPPALAYVRNTELRHDLQQAIHHADLRFFDGNKIIEIKPKNIHKGEIAKQKLVHYDPDFILSIGDDYTDENMFAALPAWAFTIKVGLKDSSARFHIESVERVVELLGELSQIKAA